LLYRRSICCGLVANLLRMCRTDTTVRQKIDNRSRQWSLALTRSMCASFFRRLSGEHSGDSDADAGGAGRHDDYLLVDGRQPGADVPVAGLGRHSALFRRDGDRAGSWRDIQLDVRRHVDVQRTGVRPDELLLRNRRRRSVKPRCSPPVAEWLACWTQEQKGMGSNRGRDAVG